MTVAGVGFNGIVPELLTNDNYERWSVLMKNYLIGHGLWNVVLSLPDRGNEEWQKKNALALYAIQLSCGPYAFPEVQRCETAKIAWNQLSLLSSTYKKIVQDIEKGEPDDGVAEEDRKVSNVIFDELFKVNGKIKDLYDHLKGKKLEEAKSCIDEDPNIPLLQSPSGRTILHIAVMVETNFLREEIVENLINLVSEKKQLLEKQENYGYTALALAATYTDSKRIAECMVSNCENLLTMRSNNDEIPILLACDNGHKEMTRYLYKKTPGDILTKEKYHYGVLLLARCIRAEIFDVALALLRRYPHLPLIHEKKELRPLYVLAQKPAVFPSGCQLKSWWQKFFYKRLYVEDDIRKIINDLNDTGGRESTSRGLLLIQMLVQNLLRQKFSGINELFKIKLKHYLVDKILEEMSKTISESQNPEHEDISAYDAILAAAKHGIIEFICSMRKAKPHLLLATDESNSGIATYAIRNHRLDLLHEIYKLPEEQLRVLSRHVDKYGNNMLHLAAESGSSFSLESSSCAALQMRRELQLFKKVEKMADPICKEAKNVYGKKPRDVFDETHDKLVKAGEKWIKNSANSFILVGTLIVTIMFAAVFTVPGGFNQETGMPILLNRNWFKVFIIADAISLFLSTTAMLIFVWIISSRYNERDLLASLPFKLVAGQFILFLSIVSMVVAFGAALILMLRGEWSIVTAAMGFACIPVIVFFTTQLPLFIDAFRQNM